MHTSELFDTQYGKGHQSKPWRLGILVVERQLDNGDLRRVRLLSRSG
jgi:hypothetical protein